MQLVDIVMQKFGDIPAEYIKQVIMALSPCCEGIAWLESQSDTREMIKNAPYEYLVWFSKSFLREADLRQADLRGADLSGANLREASLYHADLRRANLRGADLRGADLHYANLYYADLRGADLSGAAMRGANLRGADLSMAIVSKEQIPGAFVNDDTILPETYHIFENKN